MLRKSNSSMLCSGYQAWSFADKPCITLNHSRMRAVAVGLLSLRHVHWVHQVHQVHLAKCFVTKTCASTFDRAPGIRLGLFAGAYRQPLHPGARWHRVAEMVLWHAGRGLGKMWQNVLKISPLFCGKIFKIFCHGLPAGGGQLFRTSTIFLPCF